MSLNLLNLQHCKLGKRPAFSFSISHMHQTPAFVPSTALCTASVTAEANVCANATTFWGASAKRGRSARNRKLECYVNRPRCSAEDGSEDPPLTKQEQDVQDMIDNLEAKPLRWSEIPFENIQEELKAIEDYERDQELRDDDVWPKFLRGAAYEYWGQPHLALAQYAKAATGSGLRRVPELWERRAYNCFKIGKVGEANAYFDIAIELYNDSVGNELHFVHWFYEHFRDYVPKRNGPVAPIQRGICKYCVDEPKRAREALLPQIFLKDRDMEHAMLWFLASSARMTGDGLASRLDLKVVNDARKEEFDWNPRLVMFIDLFCAHGEGFTGRVSEVEEQLSQAMKVDEKDDISTYVYLALYHDAFTEDKEERDRALDTVAAIGSTHLPNDTENFLFCAAKNRISAPPDAKKTEIPELRD